MQIVKFANGSYGIRRKTKIFFIHFTEFLDLHDAKTWRTKSDHLFPNCEWTLDKCQEAIIKHALEYVKKHDYGTPI